MEYHVINLAMIFMSASACYCILFYLTRLLMQVSPRDKEDKKRKLILSAARVLLISYLLWFIVFFTLL